MNDTSNNAPSDEQPGVPTRGCLLGIDFGTKRVGFAISSRDQSLSSPLKTWQRQTPNADARFVKKLVQEYDVKGLVVGLPLHMSGDEGGVAIQAREFGDWLSEQTKLPVSYWDERFTSAAAETLLYSADLSPKERKAKIDKLAAHLILQSFLDAEDRNQKPPSYPQKEG